MFSLLFQGVWPEKGHRTCLNLYCFLLCLMKVSDQQSELGAPEKVGYVNYVNLIWCLRIRAAVIQRK